MNATIYFQGGYGMVKMEVSKLSVELKPYAQYDKAVHVEFVPRGKRKARGFVQSYRPSLLVLEGWGHPDPDSAFLPPTDQGDGVATLVGRYSSCDPRWQGDFDAKMKAYLETTSSKVLHDFRVHDASSRTFVA